MCGLSTPREPCRIEADDDDAVAGGAEDAEDADDAGSFAAALAAAARKGGSRRHLEPQQGKSSFGPRVLKVGEPCCVSEGNWMKVVVVMEVEVVVVMTDSKSP